MSHNQPKTIIAAGGVVYRVASSGVLEVVLVSNNSSGDWRLPKGIQGALPESVEEAAVREVREETGIITTVESYLCSTRWTYEYAGEEWDKTVFWFLLRPLHDFVLDHDVEYDEVQWLPIEDSIKRLTYDSEKRVLEKAHDLLKYNLSTGRLKYDPGLINFPSSSAPLIFGSEMVYEGTRLKVYSKKVGLPTGEKFVTEMLQFPDIVVVVPVVDNHIVFVLQYRYPLGRPILELPAGTVNLGETPEECAVRELKEETGFGCEGIEMLGMINLSPHVSSESTFIFLARGLQPGTKQVEKGEILHPVKLSFSETRRRMAAGNITDAKTLVALQLAFP